MKGDISTPKVKTVAIVFDGDTSHTSVLSQAINGLTRAGFASEKEIKEEWAALLSI